MDQFEREEERLMDDLDAGRITQKEYDAEMREMRYAYQAEYERAQYEAQQEVARDWGMGGWRLAAAGN